MNIDLLRMTSGELLDYIRELDEEETLAYANMAVAFSRVRRGWPQQFDNPRRCTASAQLDLELVDSVDPMTIGDIEGTVYLRNVLRRLVGRRKRHWDRHMERKTGHISDELICLP